MMTPESLGEGRRLRRSAVCCCFAAATILLGLGLRLDLGLLPVGMPAGVVKYGGSVLWAAMVYLLLAALLPQWRPVSVALAACLVAALVELFRLFHTPGLDAFRLTLAGKLLLGRVFALEHFPIYWGAIALAAFVDSRLGRRASISM